MLSILLLRTDLLYRLRYTCGIGMSVPVQHCKTNSVLACSTCQSTETAFESLQNTHETWHRLVTTVLIQHIFGAFWEGGTSAAVPALYVHRITHSAILNVFTLRVCVFRTLNYKLSFNVVSTTTNCI